MPYSHAGIIVEKHSDLSSRRSCLEKQHTSGRVDAPRAPLYPRQQKRLRDSLGLTYYSFIDSQFNKRDVCRPRQRLTARN